MSAENILNANLKELHSSGYEVSDGEPDIRGWKVRTNDNRDVGKIDELLFDVSSLRVRYLVLDLQGKILNLVSRHLLIPIGLAELDVAHKIVYFPAVTVAHLASLPDYKKGKVSLETERTIRNAFAPKDGIEYKDVDYADPEEFYRDDMYSQDRMYRSGRTPREPYPDKKKLTDQEGTAEHKAEQRAAQEGSFAPFQEGAIEIPQHSEVPIVSKETRVVEEVALNKEVKERDQKVRDTVRKNEVDVERIRKEDLSD
jgi:hypothetical protein